MPHDLQYLLGEVRELTRRYKRGDQESFEAFRYLTAKLLELTILAHPGAVILSKGPRAGTFALGGWNGPTDPLPLNDGRYLRLSMTLFLEPADNHFYLKVYDSSYQYQMDPEGRQWIFRYDYLRYPDHPKPASHLQIQGGLSEDCLPERKQLKNVHFPDARVSLEAVIRLLAEQFAVPCNTEPGIWRPVLAETEREFQRIAHRPLSGPEQ